jgi:predicted nucleic acid-binding protein
VATNYAIDASSIINLNNAGALPLACKLIRCRFWLSPIVVGECEPSCAATIAAFEAAGMVSFVDETLVPSGLFLSLLDQNRLGEGETEAIAVSIALGYHFCCDDLRARTLGETLLGRERVVGTIRLLLWCVEDRLIGCEEAFQLCGAMREAGGFLPQMTQGFFCNGLVAC